MNTNYLSIFRPNSQNSNNSSQESQGQFQSQKFYFYQKVTLNYFLEAIRFPIQINRRFLFVIYFYNLRMLDIAPVRQNTQSIDRARQQRGQVQTIQHLPTTLNVISDTAYYQDFRLNNNRIKFCKSFTTYYSQLLLNEQIPKNCVYVMKWRINSTKERGIFLGITKLEYKYLRNSHQLRDAYSYFSKKNLRFPGRHQSGKGFKAGSTVQIRFDQKKNSITWFVDNEKQARIQQYKKIQASTPFVPFIQMVDTGDEVEWLGSWTQ